MSCEAVDKNIKSIINVITRARSNEKTQNDSEKKDKKKKLSPQKAKEGTFTERYNRYLSNEYSLKEVSDIHSQGNDEVLKKAEIASIYGASKDVSKLGITVVHLGYSKEEMESPEFRKYMAKTKADFNNLYGKQDFDIGFLIPKDELKPSIYGIERLITIDNKQSAIINRKIKNERKNADLIEFRINPNLVGRDYFGAGGNGLTTMIPGPKKRKDGSYSVDRKYLCEHEMMHSISSISKKHCPLYAGDGYIRDFSESEAYAIATGLHYEYIIESPDEKGKPVKSSYPPMQKLLKENEKKIKDTNVFLKDDDGTEYKILTINPVDNIMNASIDNKYRDELIKKGHYITDMQRKMLKMQVNAYLVGEKRRENQEENQKQISLLSSNQKQGDIKKKNKTINKTIVKQKALER